MKKLFSLSVAAVLGIAAMAQDTSTNRQTNPSQSNMDTVPGNNRSQRDSLKWKDSTGAAKSNNMDTSSKQSNTWRRSDSTLDQRSDSGTSHTTDRANTQDSGMSNNNQATGQDQKTNNSSDTRAGVNKADQHNQADLSKTAETVTDRILMRNDSLLIITNGQAAALDKDYSLQSGAIVSKGGSVKYPSGKTVQLKNGQFIELIVDDSKDEKTSKGTTPAKSTKKSTKSTKTKKTTKTQQ